MSLSHRQRLLLQQVGITHYQLRYPERLQGEYLFKIATTTRLLLVSHTPLNYRSTLLQDVLKTLDLTPIAYQNIPIAQLASLSIPQYCVIWLFDNLTLPMTNTNYPLLQTGSLEEISQSATQKRQLWQQLCQYIDYFDNRG